MLLTVDVYVLRNYWKAVIINLYASGFFWYYTLLLGSNSIMPANLQAFLYSESFCLSSSYDLNEKALGLRHYISNLPLLISNLEKIVIHYDSNSYYPTMI